MNATIPRPIYGKSSLTFENVVCTQLELQRRATSFSHRRSTMCRRSFNYPISSNRLSTSSNRILLGPMSSSSLSTTPYSSGRLSSSIPSDITSQFLKTRNSASSRQSRPSSSNSVFGSRISNVTDRQSFVSMFYWDTSSRNTAISKKVLERNSL